MRSISITSSELKNCAAVTHCSLNPSSNSRKLKPGWSCANRIKLFVDTSRLARQQRQVVAEDVQRNSLDIPRRTLRRALPGRGRQAPQQLQQDCPLRSKQRGEVEGTAVDGHGAQRIGDRAASRSHISPATVTARWILDTFSRHDAHRRAAALGSHAASSPGSTTVRSPTRSKACTPRSTGSRRSTTSSASATTAARPITDADVAGLEDGARRRPTSSPTSCAAHHVSLRAASRPTAATTRRGATRRDCRRARRRSGRSRSGSARGSHALGVDEFVARSTVAAEHEFVLRTAAEGAELQMSEAEESLAAELASSGSLAWQRLHGDVVVAADGRRAGRAGADGDGPRPRDAPRRGAAPRRLRR